MVLDDEVNKAIVALKKYCLQNSCDTCPLRDNVCEYSVPDWDDNVGGEPFNQYETCLFNKQYNSYKCKTDNVLCDHYISGYCDLITNCRNKLKVVGCAALYELICSNKKCPFYKDNRLWKLDDFKEKE